MVALAALALLPLVSAGQTNDAVSREVSVFNFGQPSTTAEAISREVSVFNFEQPSVTAEAISREVSVFNFGQPSTSAEGISREVSIFNFGQPSTSVEAISREVSVFNRGQSSFDAVSREVSVFNFVGVSLRAVSIAAPTDAFTGMPFSLSWMDTNSGNVTATGPWVDNVYLSPTPQFQLAGSHLLGSFQYSSNLPAGQAVAWNQTVVINPVGVTNGQYYIVVVADANGAVPLESNPNNPLGISSSLTLHVAPSPDLVVSGVQALGPLISGQKLNVTYRVLNQGSVPASGGWIDRVYLSTNATVAGAIASLASQEYQTLATNAGYARTNSLTLPAIHSGTYYLIAVANANNKLYESNTANNALTATVPVATSGPVLVTSLPLLQTAMVRGGQKVISFSVANVGAQASGDLQVILPGGAPWLSLVSTQLITSLLPGQSNLVTLALTPSATLPLGPYLTSILLHNPNVTQGMSCEFDCVSDLKGAAQVTVQDEFSIYGVGAPNVSNATVCLTQLLTGTNQVCGVTDASGLLTFTNQPEGYYNLSVQADQHSGYSGVLYLSGSQTQNITAFLARQDLVSYAWLVTTSSIPDHYNFQLITTFESGVPPEWPVISVDPGTPSGAINLCDYVGATNALVNLNITNSGLLTAQGLQLGFASHPDWLIQPLFTDLGDLAGMSSTNVPVLISQVGSSPVTNQIIDAQLVWHVSAPNRADIFYNSLPAGFVYNADPTQCGSGGSPFGPLLAPIGPNSSFNLATLYARGIANGTVTGASPGSSYCMSCGNVGSSVQQPWAFPPAVQLVADGGRIRANVRLSQNVTTTRKAFSPSLVLTNNSGTTLTNVKVTLSLQDSNNAPAFNVFGLMPATNVLTDAALPTSSSQDFAWAVVPSTNAAPASVTQYAVSGSLTYIERGVAINIPIPPIPFWVEPEGSLQADYFLSRDVYGDDPISLNVVEPSLPFALGLLMRNLGNGVARGVSLDSAQPLVESTNGLVIPFQLIGSQVGAQVSSPRWDHVDLADISPHSRAEALWWITSPLIGQFVEYAATFQEVDDFGNTNLSLVDSIALHPLAHVVRATYPIDDGLPDFLTFDPNDLYGLPANLYNSDGSVTNVTSLTDPIVSGQPSPLQTNITLSLVTPATGWVYLRLIDPATNGMVLGSVQRSDGKFLMLGSNVWTTPSFRTNVAYYPGASPIQPPFLHLFDFNPATNYILSYRIAGPAICPQNPRFVVDGQRLMFTNCISDITANPPFFWGLDGTAPAGATLNPTNGVFNWTPTCNQGSRIYSISIWATNSASPPAASVTTLLVAVSDCLEIGVGSGVVQIGRTSCVPVTVLSSVGLTNLSFVLNTAPDRFTNWTIVGLDSTIGQTGVFPLDNANTRLAFAAQPGQNFLGPLQICSICASTMPGPSAFVSLSPTDLVGTNTVGLPMGNASGQSGRMVIIGREPLLEATLSAGSQRQLTLYGNPNSSYAIGSRTNLTGLALQPGATNWPVAWRVPMTNLWQTFAPDQNPPQLYYQAWEFFADPPILDLRRVGAANLQLLIYGRAGTNYVIEGATNLLSPSWQPVGPLQLTNSFQWLNLGGPTNKNYLIRVRH
jgi:hypothetical protein